MTLTSQQLWQETYRRLMRFEAELPVAEQTVDAVLDTLPLRLPLFSASWRSCSRVILPKR